MYVCFLLDSGNEMPFAEKTYEIKYHQKKEKKKKKKTKNKMPKLNEMDESTKGLISTIIIHIWNFN